MFFDSRTEGDGAGANATGQTPYIADTLKHRTQNDTYMYKLGFMIPRPIFSEKILFTISGIS